MAVARIISSSLPHTTIFATAPSPRFGLSSSCKSVLRPTTALPLTIGRTSSRGANSVRVMAASTSTAAGADSEEVKVLKKGIATFYDESSALWESMWGEHMHHGYYEVAKPDSPTTSEKVDHQQAQRDMIENSLRWAQIPDAEGERPRSIVDVGCGIGGSARHLARKYSATVQAITLSPYQAQRGNEICKEQGLSDKVTLHVADALNQPFSDGSFDLVWSMESGEHMPDKRKFVNELARVAAPGGRILIVTWCHRDLDKANGELTLTDSETSLLKRICDAFFLPEWCSASDYANLAAEAGLEDIRTADWSDNIAPFWPAVISSALSLKGFFGLLRTGWTTIKGAFAMIYMVQGFQRGLIKFALITARKQG